MGHVFSDDSYYAQLAYSYLQGEFGSDFVGYPIHLARKLITFLTMFSFMIFGEGEFASVFFPFLFSILSIVLIYFVSYELTDSKKVSLLAAFILAIFPTDIVFASLNFSDLIAAFLLNMGIYYIIKLLKTEEPRYTNIAGLYFALSIFAKMNFYYVGILIVVLAIYFAFKREKNKSLGLLFTTVFPLFILIVESVIVGMKTGNYSYRLQILDANYKYTYYNFFPYTILGSDYTGFEYVLGVLKQVFIENVKNIFLRRFYLLIPLIALLASIIYIKKRKYLGLTFWFIGLAVLMIGFTTSPTSYKPLDLRMSWYAYPLFFPAIILFSLFVKDYLSKAKFIVVGILLAASFYMTMQYHVFFDVSRKNKLENFVQQHQGDFIFTDHHTKYGIDLVRGYVNNQSVSSLTNKPTNLSELPKNSLLIYNKEVIDELMLQGNSFPDFTELIGTEFKIVEKIGEFKIYRKVE